PSQASSPPTSRSPSGSASCPWAARVSPPPPPTPEQTTSRAGVTAAGATHRCKREKYVELHCRGRQEAPRPDRCWNAGLQEGTGGVGRRLRQGRRDPAD